jgi:hypothetical protein
VGVIGSSFWLKAVKRVTEPIPSTTVTTPSKDSALFFFDVSDSPE